MANNLGKILEFLEIPQVKLAEFLGITPQALSSIIQAENTKKYNAQIADYIGTDVDIISYFLSLDKINKSQLINLKIVFLKKQYGEEFLKDFGKSMKISKLEDEMYNESTLEEIRKILNDNENETDKWIIYNIIDYITHKNTKYGIIEYEIVKNFMFMLSDVSTAHSEFKLETYQNILSFIKGINIPKNNVDEYIKSLIVENKG
jgi:predicted transcriptional regulator